MSQLRFTEIYEATDASCRITRGSLRPGTGGAVVVIRRQRIRFLCLSGVKERDRERERGNGERERERERCPPGLYSHDDELRSQLVSAWGQKTPCCTWANTHGAPATSMLFYRPTMWTLDPPQPPPGWTARVSGCEAGCQSSNVLSQCCSSSTLIGGKSRA